MKVVNTFFLVILFFYANAQSELYTPVDIQKTYDHGVRNMDGTPGKAYFQNKAHYDIKVTLDPAKSSLTGKEEIIYTNNSPDTLKEIVVALLMDIFRDNNQGDYWFSPEKIHGGVKLHSVKINNQIIAKKDQKRRGTNLFLQLSDPLLPGTSIQLNFEWSFEFPDVTVRMGDYGDSTFFVAYFYPKVAVYEAVDGWDRTNYDGLVEFYGEFADYEVEVTVPKDFLIWSTGELQNPKEVLRRQYAKRYARAKESTEVYHIVLPEDVSKRKITKNKSQLHWKFKAKNVGDFAFATSDKYLWDGLIIHPDKNANRSTFAQAAYAIDSKDYYKVADLTATLLMDYSTDMPGFPYPYPEMTIFNARAGMEFPMMCNNASNEKWEQTFGLAYHEAAHTYFPFIMGINERKYAWMEEGWATFFPFYFFDKRVPGNTYFQSRMKSYYQIGGKEIEVPLMTVSRLLHERAPYRQASYNKAFFAYYNLLEYLGDELFKKALRGYMRRWAFKHPIPYDFFYSFNNLTRKNLNWYWKAWFFDEGHADLAIEKIDSAGIHVKNVGRLPLPVKLTVTYTGGKTETIERDLSVWKDGAIQLTIPVYHTENITAVQLGDDRIIDVNLDNNHWEK